MKKIVLICLASLLMFGCSEDLKNSLEKPISHKSETVSEEGDFMEVEFDARIMEEDNSGITRSLHLDNNNHLKIDFGAMNDKTVTVHICLKKDNDPATASYYTAEGKVRVSSSNPESASLLLPNGKIKLKGNPANGGGVESMCNDRHEKNSELERSLCRIQYI